MIYSPETTIPLFKVNMPYEALDAVDNVLMSGNLTQGKKVEEFEALLAKFIGNPNVLTVNSCTSAIQLALRLANVGPGDEVISTPMTCSATNLPVLATGAKIVWADINPTTGLIDPESVASKLTPRTRAVICVDWGGNPCALDQLAKIAHSVGAYLIEDAAHAFGASYNSKKVGNHADFTCFSFQAIKHITTGDGGLLVCKNTDNYKRGKLLRWYGIDREAPRLDFRIEQDIVEWGYKFHMNDIAATLGIAQMQQLNVLDQYKENAIRYHDLLSEKFIPACSNQDSAYWLYTVCCPTGTRDYFIQYMLDRKIQVSKVHARNDLFTCFTKAGITPLPEDSGVAKFNARQVSLPVYAGLKLEEQFYIIQTANRFFRC